MPCGWLGQGDEPLDGVELHSKVSAQRWCVSKHDLKSLRGKVWKAVRTGRIVPTEQDPFDAKDGRFGPSVYTVCEQYIKPVTAQAGNMSWALMRHPRGRSCDLFITHAWQEGIFEFLDKVLTSWPSRCRGAWCCVLANPQNLDISSLLSSPQDSPFALALSASRYMLVVPNRHQSIYTRLWCVYEAHLAYEWNKVIVSASEPEAPHFLKVLPLALFFALAGAGIGMVWGQQEATHCAVEHMCHRIMPLRMRISVVLEVLIYLIVASTVFVKDQWWYRCLNWTGLFVSSHYMVMLAANYHNAQFFKKNMHPETWDEWRDSRLGFSIGAVVFFFFSEADRVRYNIVAEEGRRLEAGFTGTIVDAKCSHPADAQNIWAAIRGDADSEDEITSRIAMVDTSISLLVRAGMSSASLRQAAEEGVDVDGIVCGDGFAFMLLLSFSGLPRSFDKSDRQAQIFGHIFAALVVSLWAVYFCGQLDRRLYLRRCFVRIVLVFVWPAHLLAMILWQMKSRAGTDLVYLVSISNIVGMLLALIAGVLGLGRVARLPCCGPFIAQMLISRGKIGFCAAWQAQVRSKERRRTGGTGGAYWSPCTSPWTEPSIHSLSVQGAHSDSDSDSDSDGASGDSSGEESSGDELSSGNDEDAVEELRSCRRSPLQCCRAER